MNQKAGISTRFGPLHKLTGAVAMLVGISACSLSPYSEITTSSEYEACIAQAWSVDQQAHQLNGEPQFLLAAKLFSACESDLQASEIQHPESERMVAVAMSSLNFARGGDIGSAMQQLTHFERSFPRRDLYFPDGSSFVDTMRLVTGSHDYNDSSIRLINVNDNVRAEFYRLGEPDKGGI